MELKSEKSIKEYLKTLPDDTIIKYYLDVEYTPFPVLVIQEFTRRFKHKTKDEILRDLKYQARLAQRKALALKQMAKKHKILDEVTRQKSEEIFMQATKKGYEVSESIIQKGGVLGTKLTKTAKTGINKGIKAGTGLRTPSVRHLALLEDLERLKKSKIITTKEFQEKKKEILSRI